MCSLENLVEDISLTENRSNDVFHDKHYRGNYVNYLISLMIVTIEFLYFPIRCYHGRIRSAIEIKIKSTSL